MGGKKTPKYVDTEAIAKAEAEAERKKTIERQRRGIEGTINTSFQGILNKKEDGLKRKNLLGE